MISRLICRLIGHEETEAVTISSLDGFIGWRHATACSRCKEILKYRIEYLSGPPKVVDWKATI